MCGFHFAFFHLATNRQTAQTRSSLGEWVLVTKDISQWWPYSGGVRHFDPRRTLVSIGH